MNCVRCQGCMAREHFMDIQESGGEMWAASWRCLNCGNVFDPVVERNRRLHNSEKMSVPAIVGQQSQVAVVDLGEEMGLAA